jgi:N-acetylglucosamine-6-phosphate deacetylase
MEDFRKAMAARLSSRMRDLRLERDAEFAAAATRQGTGVALVLVTDKLAKRDAEFGSPKYKHSRITVRDQMAAHKGSLAGDRVGFAKPIKSGQGQTVA